MDQPAHLSSHKWIYATAILCSYGFFKELKPSEPFLTPYLVDSKNFTKNEVNGKIYPFWSYSYLVSAFFVFLLTDIVRYKPVILLESVAYLTTRVLLIWGTSVFAMQMMQVAYGVATATEIAYFSYIYAAVSIVHFKKVTSYVRAVRLFGQASAGAIGQVLWQTHVVSLQGLNYISFGSVCVACVFAILLPNVCDYTSVCYQAKSKRRLENDGGDVQLSQAENEDQKSCRRTAEWLMNILRNRWKDFRKFYSNLSLLRWSIWWALATCGWLQVGNYVQSLWKEVTDESGATYDYNGLVEALATLCSAAAAFVLSFLKVNWSVWGEVTIGALSMMDSLLLLVASSADELWLAYLCHILYRTTYSFLITIARSAIPSALDVYTGGNLNMSGSSFSTL